MSVARVYAKALYETYGTNGSSEKLQTEKDNLSHFLSLMNGSKELKSALLQPVISAKEKIAIVEELAKKGEYSALSTRFLSLLAKKNRIGALGAILRGLEEVSIEAMGGLMGEVVSADPIESKDVQSLEESFEKKLKRKIKFSVSTDPQLLAGVKVTVGGVTYDGTLRSQLNRLRDAFVHEGYGVH